MQSADGADLTPADGRAHQRSQTRGRSSESHFSHTHPTKIIISSFSLFQIPALLSAGDLPPPLTHDALLSSFDISNTLSPLPPFRSSPYPLPASVPPSSNPLPCGSTFLSLRFDSSFFRAHHCSPHADRQVTTPSRLAAHFQSRIHATILISHAHLPFFPCFPITLDPIYSSCCSCQPFFRDSKLTHSSTRICTQTYLYFVPPMLTVTAASR